MTTSSSAGYSGTPLVKKLGIKAGMQVLPLAPPADLAQLLAPLPADVQFVGQADASVDLALAFVAWRSGLQQVLTDLRRALRSDAILWICWPKQAARLPTDISENTIRELALPLGWVDIKVCAVSPIWSGLKLVVRKTLR